jgi:FkbM family methyltransferase
MKCRGKVVVVAVIMLVALLIIDLRFSIVSMPVMFFDQLNSLKSVGFDSPGFPNIMDSIGCNQSDIPAQYQYELAVPDTTRVRSKKSHGARCSIAQLVQIASQEPVPKTACPHGDKWLSALLNSSLKRSEATIVLIGCNKGGGLIRSMRRWSGNNSYNAALLNSFQQLNRGCPLEIESEFDTANAEIRPVRGFCVEAMPLTVNLLQTTFGQLGYFPAVTLIHAAASSVPGTLDFPDESAGTESLGIGSSNTRTVSVKAVTLDQMVDEHDISSIDHLSINTKGYDMRVIFGAVHALGAQIVRFLEFEYHGVNRWARSDLQDLIDLLDQFGYDCYWEGGHGWAWEGGIVGGTVVPVNSDGKLWRLTGCWHDSYYDVYKNMKSNGNVACANRNEIELINEMERMAASINAAADIPADETKLHETASLSRENKYAQQHLDVDDIDNTTVISNLTDNSNGSEHHDDQRLSSKLVGRSVAKNPSDLLVFSFYAIHTSYSGYASNPTDFFKPYLKNRICYLKKHNIAFALQTVDWRKHQQFYAGVTYMKAALVKNIMRLNPPWLFFMDSDLIVVDFERSLRDYMLEQFSVIVNDHNAALNNGAFFLQNTPVGHRFLQIWDDVSNGKRAPFIDNNWPFTDNGAFIEALVQLGMNDESASRCGNEYKRTMQVGQFLGCFHNLYTELSGVKFDGVSKRVLPGNVLFSQSLRGFNNHKCSPQYINEWGWDDKACFHQNESMILHSKVFELAPVDSQACVSDEMYDSFGLEEEGTFLFLPDSDMPCRLEEESCNQRATAFFNK